MLSSVSWKPASTKRFNSRQRNLKKPGEKLYSNVDKYFPKFFFLFEGFCLSLSLINSLFFSSRRKLSARIAELEDTAEQLRVKNGSLEKAKAKLTIELREITIELENVSLFKPLQYFF